MGFFSSLFGGGSSSDLSPAQLPELLQQHTKVIWLDVRTPSENRAGSLPKSQLIDFTAPDFMAKALKLDKDALVLVYCRSGNRSSMACSALKANGFQHVYNLAGGYASWKEVVGRVK